MKNNVITTVNYHLTKECNFKCKYCFARFDEMSSQPMLSEEDSLKLIKMLADSGHFNKINFVGGEPMLVPHLSRLIKYAKECGLRTSVVTNGSRLSTDWVKGVAGYLDMLGISIDSDNNSINKAIGNHIKLEKLPAIVDAIHQSGICLKINTVVSSFNKREYLAPFINEIKPSRWKILQVTKIDGQNDKDFAKVSVSASDFKNFCDKNREGVLPGIKVICEADDNIIGSYCMIDYKGCFFDDSSKRHSYSPPILKANVEEALSHISHSYEKFVERGGKY